MLIDTDAMVPISAANQNFSRVAKLADEHGSVVIMKNNAPRYILLEINQAEQGRKKQDQVADPKTVDALAEEIMNENEYVFRELAR